MAKKKSQSAEPVRYGIGEWYGTLISDLPKEKLEEFADIGMGRLSGFECPFRQAASPGALCNKKGGVCTVRKHVQTESGQVELDGPLVTICPSRFWQENSIFEWIGDSLLGSSIPTLVKEVPFLSALVDSDDDETGDAVGRIDSILLDLQNPSDWCAVELQAVYMSGKSIGSHLAQYAAPASVPVFPDKVRRPDFRSCGPKRLMPQLQTKVPTLRRWGKKMVVLVDRPFYDSLGKPTNVKHLSNADIAWFVVDYNTDTGEIFLADVVYTTLESSVEALTAGVPLSRAAFEADIARFLVGKTKAERAKVIHLSSPSPSPDGGSLLHGGAELPEVEDAVDRQNLLLDP